jgi:hypothetical protein
MEDYEQGVPPARLKTYALFDAALVFQGGPLQGAQFAQGSPMKS